MICFNNVCIKRNNFTILDKINIKIHKGEFVYLLGPNGAGKTTLVETMLKLLRSTSGTLETNYLKAGFLPQRLNVDLTFPATVKEIIYSGFINNSFFHNKLNHNKYQSLIKEFNLEKLEKKLIGELSGGELQKVMFVRALVNDPDLIILDEPTSAIDINHKQLIIDKVRKLNQKFNTTVIFITHELLTTDCNNCTDRVIYIDKKIIFDNSFCEYTKSFLNKAAEHHHHV